MSSIRIVLSFYAKLSFANFKYAMQGIINALTGNTNFPTPNPSLESLQDLLDQYEDACVSVEEGNLTHIPNRDLAREGLFMFINQLSGYLLNTAMATSDSIIEAKAKIKSANMVVYEPGQKLGPLPAPGNIRGKSLTQACQVEYDGVKGAIYYVIMKTEGYATDSSVWQEITTPHVKYKFDNLTPGTIITARVFAVGPLGRGEGSAFYTMSANV